MPTSMILAIVVMLSTSGCVFKHGADNEHIPGGAADNNDPSVVQLRYQVADAHGVEVAACTATVITPTTLLTAGHCAGGSGYQYNASPSADPLGNDPGWINAAAPIANPAYDGNAADGHDIALVQLGSPTEIRPSALGSAPSVGTTVRAVGYGLTTGTTSDPSGTKEQNSFAVQSVTTHELVGGPEETCQRDSGGPIFDGNNTVVGTTSYGDTADCHGNTHFMRVDDNLDWIASITGGSGSGGGGGGGSGGGSGSGSGSGTTSQCDTAIDINGMSEEVKCTDGSCECIRDNTLVATCTDNGNSCSIPGSCCGF
jgi:V8-like Glu-specific endopeptidase